MKISVMLLVVGLTNAVVAMDQSKTTTAQNPVTTLKGIVARSSTGHLECSVTHNATTNTYSGELFNRGYDQAEWFSQGLDAIEGQQYYQQLQAAAAITTHAKAKDSNEKS